MKKKKKEKKIYKTTYYYKATLSLQKNKFLQLFYNHLKIKLQVKFCMHNMLLFWGQ